MNIPYRTRRVIKRVGIIALAVLMLGILAWFCGVIFLERYVVYSRDGAHLDFDLSGQEFMGVEAVPPVGQSKVEVYFNEGQNAMNTSTELTQLDGYYIDADMLANNIDNIWSMLEPLAPGTPIMIELKAAKGTFYYTSGLPDAIQTTAASVEAVDKLIQQMHIKGFYTIAKVASLRDYTFGLNHVLSGLPMKGKQYLWVDNGGSYWLNPTSPSTQDYIISIVNELKTKGFNEVLLGDFRFPNTDKIGFSGDKEKALVDFANRVVEECSEDTFTVSFSVATPSFPLPEGRCRLYMEGVEAQDVGKRLSQVTIPEPSIKMVFVAPTNDTRYEQVGVLRPITSAEVLEAQKAEEKAQKEKEEAAKSPEEREKEKKAAEEAAATTKPPETTSQAVG